MRRDRVQNQAGAVAVEFVFIVPLLMLIFFGTIQIGLAVYRTQMVEAAAREGARVASVGADATEVRARVEASAPGFTSAELASITVETRSDVSSAWAAGGCAAPHHDVRVTVQASGDRLDYDILFVGSYEPVYSASATFRCEGT